MIDYLYSIPALFVGEWLGRKTKRQVVYSQAVERAAARGKPLLVIGDPHNGVTQGDYGYGDACVDLSGCPHAPSGRGYKLDLSSESLPFEDDSHVVFSPFVLEYVDNVDLAYSEFCRVSGSPEDLFVMTLGPTEAASYFYPGCQWILHVDQDGVLHKKCVARPARIRERARSRS